MALIAETGVIVKGMPVWKQVYGPAAEGALVVEVTGQQFEWFMRYPGPDGVFGRTRPELVDQTSNLVGLDSTDAAALDDFVLRKQMHVVSGRPTHVRLRGRDVLHSFTVPAFRVKLDVVPGIITGLNFTATTPGVYEIACAELCGMGHYKMSGRVFVHTPEAYDAWLASREGPQP
jgi:cytochrome c oxidase subunit 2